MTVPSTHLFDILNGSKLSSLLLIEEALPKSSHYFVWPTLLKRLCGRHKILIIYTELPGTKSSYIAPSSAEGISFYDYETVPDLFKAIEDRISGSGSWVILFESLDALLKLCPSDSFICDWGRLLSSYFYSLATCSSVSMVVLTLTLYTYGDGEITCASRSLSQIFESLASTCVRLSSKCISTQIDVSFWHRRTLDSVCKSIRMFPDVPPANKLAVSGLCRLKLDSPAGVIVSCSSIGTQVEKIEESLPTSSFKLTVTEEEMEAKQKVVLPYTSAINAPIASEMKVDYEPDEFDDIDDEDPDDDLLI
ncbi:unnamed protein product [Rodentolepis nana]|uniref:Elongator complex protein 5 n=1 Tax=Rodentolepis nana TaxID=102285 RepID=A0A0R3TDL2_RODNA|nr:unnamed protein product [Rodentolepis nana]